MLKMQIIRGYSNGTNKGGNLRLEGRGFVVSVGLDPQTHYVEPRFQSEKMLESCELAAWKHTNGPVELDADALTEVMRNAGVNSGCFPDGDTVSGWVPLAELAKIMVWLSGE